MLCETVKDFVARVGENVQDGEDDDMENSIAHKCDMLKTKLDALLTMLNNEAEPGLKVSWHCTYISVVAFKFFPMSCF